MNLQEAKMDLNFRIMKIGIWVIMFEAASWFLCNYESIMNSGEGLGASGVVRLSYETSKTNLANEGIIGYSVLALIGFSCFMFGKEFLNYGKTLRSLVHSDIEITTAPAGSGGEN